MDFVDFLKWYMVFVFSTTLHEAAHAFTAWKLGDDTAHKAGQVSIDPTPHIRREPFGMVVVPIVSYLLGGWMIGWASAPYNPAWALENPRRAGLMAVAGPAANFALMLLAGLAIRSGVELHFFQAPSELDSMHMTQALNDGWPMFIAKILSIFFSLNLLLGTFNLLPVPPLDGASLPLLFASRAMAVQIFKITRAPVFRLIGLYVAWSLFGRIFHPIQLFAAHLLYPDVFYQ
jgi:Zn-dependent protease